MNFKNNFFKNEVAFKMIIRNLPSRFWCYEKIRIYTVLDIAEIFRLTQNKRCSCFSVSCLNNRSKHTVLKTCVHRCFNFFLNSGGARDIQLRELTNPEMANIILHVFP